jgi:hypothetical protein
MGAHRGRLTQFHLAISSDSVVHVSGLRKDAKVRTETVSLGVLGAFACDT